MNFQVLGPGLSGCTLALYFGGYSFSEGHDGTMHCCLLLSMHPPGQRRPAPPMPHLYMSPAKAAWLSPRPAPPACQLPADNPYYGANSYSCSLLGANCNNQLACTLTNGSGNNAVLAVGVLRRK